MLVKKECVIWFLFLFFVFGFIQSIHALGVSPAKVVYGFEPGLEKTISYTVIGSATQELEVYVKGDLAQYITLDKQTIKAGDSFTATLKLPNAVDTPGRRNTYIGVREKVDPELVHGNIGTSVVIEVLIAVDVPYPGRYLELVLSSNNANVGEPINFELDITNKGTEQLTISPKIEIFSKDSHKDELDFKERTIGSQEVLNLQKTLDTSTYNPGNYKAIASINYGNIVTSESDFKIGNLNINILGYTNKVIIGRLQAFDVGIESGWNDAIDGVYGEVSILNGSKILTSFKTSTTSLTPWENKTITGYLDTTNFKKWIYDANITLFYFGKDKGNTTSQMVKVEFVEGKSLLIWYIIGGAGLLIIIIILLIKFLFNKKKKR
jgi:hypothetical protein